MSGINRQLINHALKTGRVDLTSLPDWRLRVFLQFLKNHNLEKVVVFGGAVRDVFLNQCVDDLDVTVKVALTSGEASTMRLTTGLANERVLAEAMHVIDRLSRKLGTTREELINPSQGREARFEGISVQYLGPVATTTAGGDHIIAKRILVDSVTKEFYSYHTGTALLQMALDSGGSLYGQLNSLRDLLEGRVHLVGSGENFLLGDILRLLRLKHQHGLLIVIEDYKLAIDTLAHYQRGELVLLARDVPGYIQQIRKIVESARDADAAQRELEELGIYSIVSGTWH